ncbi:MAG: glycosyltransferase family 39 protein [Candidatus Kapaibacterium sp.]
MALSAIIYLPSLFWALGLDQNIFAEIGWLLLHGQKLYVDAWDVKPPNVFYVYAFFEWLFGPHGFAVRASDYVFAMFACAAVYAATARQAPHIGRSGQEWTTPLASILLILTLLSLGLADTAQTESYSLFFLIGASALVQSPRIRGLKRDSTRLIFIAGIFLGIATFFKTTNAVFLIAIAAEVWLYNRRRWIRAMIFLLAGFAAWCAVQLCVLAAMGSLEEYLRIASSVVMNHPNEVSTLRLSDVPRAMWTYVDVWGLLALIALIIAAFRRDRSFLRTALSPILLLAAGILAVLLQNKGWGYQYVVILPGLVWLCAISAGYVYDFLRSQVPKFAMPALTAVLLVTIFITPSARRRIHYTLDALESIRNHPAYLATLGAKQSLYYPLCTDSLATYLSNHTKPSDEVFIFGEEPGIYWRANRMPATRFVYSLLFTSGVIPQTYLQAIQDSLASKKPSVIVVERFDTTAFRHRPETSESLVETDPAFQSLRALIATQYAPSDTLCEKFLIYKRK